MLTFDLYPKVKCTNPKPPRHLSVYKPSRDKTYEFTDLFLSGILNDVFIFRHKFPRYTTVLNN